MGQTIQVEVAHHPTTLTPYNLGRRRRASNHLDLIRGVAALGVVGEHARTLFFVDSPGLVRHSLLRSLCYFLTGFGHQLVMVFFVLSGYFIASTILKDIKNKQWTWRRYLTKRGVRLYVVLIPALLLTAIWDRAGIALTHNAPLYRGTAMHMVANVTERSGPGVFVGNLFFLQTVAVPTFGSDGPLWSLSNEFWYYILFPSLLLIGVREVPKTIKGCGIVAAIAIVIGCRSLLPLFPVWLLGAALTIVPYPNELKTPAMRRTLLIIAAILFLICMAAVRLNLVRNELFGDYLVGISFTFVTYLILHLPGEASRGFYAWFAGHAAGMSYTLYLAHFPPLALIAATLGLATRWQPSPVHVALVTLMVAGVVLYSFLLSRVTEANTDYFRRLISRKEQGLAT